MKFFQTLQKQYAILGICNSTNEPTHFNFFKQRVAFGFLVFGCNIVAQFVYIFHVANGFMELVNCASVTSGLIIIFVCFAVTVFRKTTLFKSIDRIEQFIDTRRKYPKSMKLFMETSLRVERVCGIVITVMVKIAVQLVMVPKIIVCFGLYFSTDSGRDSFELPYVLWFPFDWSNPIGYLAAVILEYILIGYEYFIVAYTLSLGIGAFSLVIPATEEIQRILHLINDKAQAKKKNQSNEMKILFAEYVDMHGIAKQLIHDFSTIFQPIIMSLFTWSLLAISIAMLIFQMEILQHGNIAPLLMLILNGIFAIIFVFISCELGQRMSVAFEEIELTFDHIYWYRFPIEIQRMLPIIIANAQEPVSLECFGTITCSRDVFKNVINRAYSYFTVLRQLGN